MHPALKAIREATLDSVFEDELWLVGGAVRDMLMGKPEANDFDIVTELDSAELARLLWQKRISTIPPVTYPRFGTAMIRVDGIDVELVTARRESYAEDSRKPSVEPATIHDDALRRDFTVNALFLNLHTNEIRDPLGSGFGHLLNQILQTPLDPDSTFSDDPLRMLRAIRFRRQLNFEPAIGLYESIRESRERLRIISEERIQAEFLKMLALPNADDCMRDLESTGLLEIFAPELLAMKGVDQGNYHFLDVWEHTLLALKNVGCSDIVLSLATLFHDVGKPVTRSIDENGHIRFFGHEGESARITREVLSRLKFCNADIDAVCLLVKNHMRLMSADKVSASAARRLVRDLGERLPTLLDLAEADISALRPGVPVMNIPELRERLAQVVVETPVQALQSPLSGTEIMEILGIASSPRVGQIKFALSEMVIEGELQPGDKEAATEWVRKQV